MEAIRYENSEIDERIIRAVTEIGYEEMTPIQQSAIPALLEGRDTDRNWKNSGIWYSACSDDRPGR